MFQGNTERVFIWEYMCFRAILNVCFSYTSRDEMCTAIKELAEGVESGLLEES